MYPERPEESAGIMVLFAGGEIMGCVERVKSIFAGILGMDAAFTICETDLQ